MKKNKISILIKALNHLYDENEKKMKKFWSSNLSYGLFKENRKELKEENQKIKEIIEKIEKKDNLEY